MATYQSGDKVRNYGAAAAFLHHQLGGAVPPVLEVVRRHPEPTPDAQGQPVATYELSDGTLAPEGAPRPGGACRPASVTIRRGLANPGVDWPASCYSS
jgi:hypothetical protein